MARSPSSEDTISLATQHIPRLLQNPKVNYRIHSSQLLVRSMSQNNPVHASTLLLEDPY